MKENNNTKGLVIVALAFVGVLFIGFISSGKTGISFTKTPQQTIDLLMEADYEILPEDVAYYVEFDEPGYLYVDLRNPYEFVKGNVQTSINIPQTDMLNSEALDFFGAAQKDSLKVVLIAYDEAATTGAWLILSQLGYDNLKIMKGGWNYYANESLDPYDMPDIPLYMVEEPAYDFAAIMDLMKASPAASASDDAPEVILPTRKKKKNVVEGGC